MNGSLVPPPETRERFLLAITQQIPAARIAEIHFFAPIKQGGVESGVAVVAAWPEPGVTVDQAPPQGESASTEATADLEPAESPTGKPVVYTARYRLVLKGPDRGKWEASVTAEADAPLVSVDAVVRGVQRRAGDVEEATRMEGYEIMETLKGKL
jgi:hypothetical protein